jgi:hypothetical protein
VALITLGMNIGTISGSTIITIVIMIVADTVGSGMIILFIMLIMIVSADHSPGSPAVPLRTRWYPWPTLGSPVCVVSARCPSALTGHKPDPAIMWATARRIAIRGWEQLGAHGRIAVQWITERSMWDQKPYG